MNMGPDIPKLDNAYHTVTLSGCSELATVAMDSQGIQAKDCTYCLLV
jgi:hypothetical protein